MLTRRALNRTEGIDSFDIPGELSPFVSALVFRRSRSFGVAVRLLPEVRASIQWMRADSYWQREATEGAAWRRVPTLALWGPRTRWAYGYCERTLEVGAIALTPLALEILGCGPGATVINRTISVDEFDPAFANALLVCNASNATQWCARTIAALRDRFVHQPISSLAIDRSVQIFSERTELSIPKIAERIGYSERHFRRVFEQRFGIAPKRYQRLLRVDRLLRQLHDSPWEIDADPQKPIWFSDQAHSIREFRAITGLTPQSYVRAKRTGDASIRSIPEPLVHTPKTDPSALKT